MGILFDKILDKRNVYAAAYALPGFLKEKGLIEAESKDDIELYKSLLYHPFCIDNKIINECKKILTEKLSTGSKDLFLVRVFFKFKKLRKDGTSEYRPIHTANIKTLICIQAIANALYFDDDFDTGIRHFSNLNLLIPQNFWGNILTAKPEYIYENWVKKYKGYVHVSFDKHDKYAKNKVYSHEAYLDLVNYFPNINTYILYKDLIHRLKGKYNEAELKRALQLLLCFKIDEKFNEAEQMAYYGTTVNNAEILYTKGLPQGLPHCFFLANLYLLQIKSIVKDNIDCDIDYYVDDMTMFCNLDHASLISKVRELNKKIADTLLQDRCSPIDSIESFYKTNRIQFVLKFHEEDEKCSSNPISDQKGSLRHMAVLLKNTSGVCQVLYTHLSEDSEETALSQVICLIEAIKKEQKLIEKMQGDEVALYKKRLNSYYKFYKIRKKLLEQSIDNTSEIVTTKNFPNVQSLVNDGLLQQTYYVWLQYKPEQEKDVIQKVTAFDLQMAGKDGIQENNLYFTADCKHYLSYRSLLDPTTNYASLYVEAKHNILIWRKDTLTLKLLIGHIRNINFKNEARSFVYRTSSEFKRNYILAYVCVYFNIPITVKNSYTTTGFKPLKWYELRILHYLYQPLFDASKFYTFADKTLSEAEKGMYTSISDPLIYKILPLFLSTVLGHENNDTLILSHYYVQSIWKNGSKFLHFFTLHNVEHSVELIWQSYIISHIFSIYQLSTVDYFLLFMACYYHDISLVTYPDIDTFKLETGFKFKSTDLRKRMIEAYRKIDSYFENEIRSTHPAQSAILLRTKEVFRFLDDSTRDLVANISEAHGKDAMDIYISDKGQDNSIEKVMSRMHITHLKSILRMADSLDMAQDRVSPIYLDNVFSFMPEIARFHWISHLAVNHCAFKVKCKLKNRRDVKNSESFLSPKNLLENISLNIFFNTSLDIIADTCCMEQCKKVNVKRSSNGYHIILGGKNCEAIKDGICPLLCKWVHKKNKYINEELIHIANMSNDSADATFTTKVDVNYLLDKNNKSTDKYITFVENYLNEKNKRKK